MTPTKGITRIKYAEHDGLSPTQCPMINKDHPIKSGRSNTGLHKINYKRYKKTLYHKIYIQDKSTQHHATTKMIRAQENLTRDSTNKF